MTQNGVFPKLIIGHDKQCTCYTKLLLPQGNWVNNTPPHQWFPLYMKTLQESNRYLLRKQYAGFIPLKYNITGTTQYILDMSENEDDYSDSYFLCTV